MKSSSIICLATLIAVRVLIGSAEAQTTALVGFTEQSWQYYEAGDQPADNNGVNWQAPTYDDSAWKTGYGFFANEPDTPSVYSPINTSLTLSNAGATENTRTFYFRTRFNFSGDPTNIFLYFTNVVDDGCVAYLNGFRVYGVRVPKIDPTYDDLASGGPAGEGNRELVAVFNSPWLRQGDNVLALEVKQASPTSSDVAWNLALAYSRPDSVVITRQPPSDLAAVEADNVALAIEITGTDPQYRWFRNDVFLTGQTNRTLTLTNIKVSQAGTYYVTVSNAVNSIRSSNTILTVVPDTFGPRILNAWVPISETNRMLIQFNEDINHVAAANPISGLNTNNYFVTVLGQTNRLRMALAQVGLGIAQVRLTFDTNINRSLNYQICISNITDVRTNAIAWNSYVPIGFEIATNPIVYQDAWSYHEWGFEPEGGDWKAVDYFEDPTRWIQTAAGFSTSRLDPTRVPCTSQNWVMSVGYCAYYFRKKFVMPANLVGVKMNATLGHVVDDGAVFYLNGTELVRYNMPAGPVSQCTRASSSVDAACRENTFADLMFQRTNVLVVELHEFNPGTFNDLDAAFDASLTLRYIRYPAFPQPTDVRIFATNQSATELSVYFTNGFGYAIQSKTNLTEPWREVQPITNRFITPTSNPQRFFRLEKGHSL